MKRREGVSQASIWKKELSGKEELELMTQGIQSILKHSRKNTEVSVTTAN